MAVPLGLYKNYSAMACGQPVEVDVTGKKLVIPVADELHMIGRNQYTLSTANGASPYGGAAQFSAPPDNLPGTVRIIGGDDCYLMPTDQSVKSKVLHSGYLDAIDALTFDNDAHTMTSEFTIVNEGIGEDATVINSCDDTTNFSLSYGTGNITVENGRIKVVGTTDATGKIAVQLASANDLASFDFITLEVEADVSKQLRLSIKDTSQNELAWIYTDRFKTVSGTNIKYVLPIKAPAGTTGALPTSRSSEFAYSTSAYYIGIFDSSIPNTAVTFYIDSITACNGTCAQVEMTVPDHPLNRFDGYPDACDINGYSYNSTVSAYNTSRGFRQYTDGQLDVNNGYIVLLDGTALQDIVGAPTATNGDGAALYYVGSAGETKEMGAYCGDSSPTITYSDTAGTTKRVGIAIDLPPSDGNRTGINKFRVKFVIPYDDELGNRVPDLSGNGNHGTIVGGVTKLNGGGLKFGGLAAGGYIDMKNPDSLSRGGSFTAFGRVKINASAFGALIGKWSTTANPTASFLCMVRDTGKITIYVENGTDFDFLSSDDNLSIGTEAFVAYRYDQENLKLHVTINDTTVSKDTAIPSVNITASNVQIGGYYNGSQILNGDIYSVHYIPRCIPDSEIVSARDGVIPSDALASYTPSIKNMGASTIELSNDTDLATGLQHMANPYLFLYDPATSLLDYFVFSEHPDYIKYVQDENGDIVRLILHPGNGTVYHAQTTYPDITLDGDSDDVPNVFSDDAEGSVMKLLKGHDFVHDDIMYINTSDGGRVIVNMDGPLIYRT